MFPSKLKKDSLVAIANISDPFPKERRKELEIAIKNAKKLGLKILISKTLMQSQKKRVEEFNEFLKNKDIKAIFFARGGDSAEKILDYLNWKTLRKFPKIFLGMSDNTVFLNAVIARTNLVTFHGHNFVGGFCYDGEFFSKEIKRRLFEGKNEIKTKIELVNGSYGFSGKLIGGNLRCFFKIFNTKYMPSFKNSVLLFETFKIHWKKCKNLIRKLKEKEIEKIKGIIVGSGKIEGKNTSLEEIIKKELKEFDLPIVKIENIGHVGRNLIIPLGVKIKIEKEYLRFNKFLN